MTAINVGVIGFGTIGTGVVRILQKDAALLSQKIGRNITIKTVADLNFTEKDGIDSTDFTVSKDANDIVNDRDIQIVVELIGGVQPAKSFIESALKSGKHVVTANKELIAKHGKELIALAGTNNVNLFFEASTGGGIPIITSMLNSLAANRFRKVYGILNGTTNYIMTKMFYEGADYAETLKEAQELGYAEADPSSDVDGHDIAYKLCILSGIAFDSYTDIEQIYREGISKISKRDIEIAKESGYTIKMLAIGVSHDASIELRVHPVMLPMTHPLAAVNGSFNAVFVDGENVDQAMFYGHGAGELPTASAVMGDVVAIARDIDNKATSASLNFGNENRTIMPMGDIQTEFYLRFIVDDKPGVLADVSRICSDNGISIRMVQQEDFKTEFAELNIMTHLVKEADMQKAIDTIGKLESVEEVASVIRMEP